MATSVNRTDGERKGSGNSGFVAWKIAWLSNSNCFVPLPCGRVCFSICYVERGSSALGRIQGNKLVWKTVASDLTVSSKAAARSFLKGLFKMQIRSCHSLPQDHPHHSPHPLQDRGAQMVMNVCMLHLQRAGGPGNSTWGSTALGKVAFLALQSSLSADKETEQPLVSPAPQPHECQQVSSGFRWEEQDKVASLPSQA